MRNMMMTGAVISAMAGPLAANPPLRDVPQIDDGLFVIGLAHEIHKNCPSIKARFFKGISALNGLKDDARDLGYSDEEIRLHVESKAEKKRLRKRAADYMSTRGHGKTKEGYCALGETEIAQKSEIGALLRATK